MKWPWSRKRKVAASPIPEVVIEDLSQWNTIFSNVTWANDTLAGMLEYVEAHVQLHTQSGGVCEPWCIPPDIPVYLNSLDQENGNNAASHVLFYVLLKAYHRRFFAHRDRSDRHSGGLP